MTRHEENIQEALKEYAAIQLFLQSDAYKLLIEPLKEKLASLKNAYDCKTTLEMATLRGEHKGLSFTLELLESYNRAGQLAKEAAEKIANKRRLNEMEIDSTSL